jgi:S-disulfanyl-L-cysteine oxidoreductase SoxD
MAAVFIACWSAGLLHVARADQTTGAGATTWSGVYTEEQATRGELLYTKHCAECHGDDLAGDGFAAALKGPDFMSNWNDLSVGDFFERIRISMPPTSPHSVSPKEKAEITAYILKSGGFPAGDTELAAETGALKSIKIVANKPGRN